MAKARLSCQSGVFSVLGAFTLLLALVSLVLALDSGRLYMEQRKLQKLADTAALETVARLDDPSCGKNDLDGVVKAFAKQNAQLNGFSPEMMTAECVSVSSPNGINKTEVNLAGNAVQTIATETVPASLILRTGKAFGFEFDSSVTLQAKAVAERSSEPTAVFSIGAQLLRLDGNKLTGSILKAVGLDVDDLRVLDSNGLANAKITPAGLLRALEVELSIDELKALSPQGLADLNSELGLIGIEKIINASVKLVSDNTLKSEASALESAFLNPELKDLQLNLFATESNSGLLSLTSGRNGNIGPALNSNMTLGDLLRTSILIGASGRALHIPELNALSLAEIELGIVEPPSLAAGPVGTTAYNSQVRLYVDIDSDKLLGGWISGLLRSLIDLRIHLPLSVDVTTAHATFDFAKCHANPPTAIFEVNSTLLNACIGDIPDEFKWSGSKRCEEQLENTELVRLKLFPGLLGMLGMDRLGVELNSKVHIAGFKQVDELTGLSVSPNPKLPKDEHYFTRVNNLAIDDAISGKNGIITGLLDLLSGLFRKPKIVPSMDYSGDKNMQIKFIARGYLESSQKGGRYNVANVTKLVLEGKKNQAGKQLLPPLVEYKDDWYVGKVIPKSSIINILFPLVWEHGNFSEALDAYSKPHGVLDLLLPPTKDGLTFCGNLVTNLVNKWNSCIEDNLVKLLQDKSIDVSIDDHSPLLDPKSDDVSCNGLLCILLKPALAILKPILNGVGELLSSILLSKTLGLELGRSALAVHDINCGAPRLVSMGSGKQ